MMSVERRNGQILWPPLAVEGRPIDRPEEAGCGCVFGNVMTRDQGVVLVVVSCDQSLGCNIQRLVKTEAAKRNKRLKVVA